MSDKIYNFLWGCGFQLDRKKTKMVIDKLRKDFENYDYNERQKYGWLFKTLLEKLDRQVDWDSADEIEMEFIRSLGI